MRSRLRFLLSGYLGPCGAVILDSCGAVTLDSCGAGHWLRPSVPNVGSCSTGGEIAQGDDSPSSRFARTQLTFADLLIEVAATYACSPEPPPR